MLRVSHLKQYFIVAFAFKAPFELWDLKAIIADSNSVMFLFNAMVVDYTELYDHSFMSVCRLFLL